MSLLSKLLHLVRGAPAEAPIHAEGVYRAKPKGTIPTAIAPTLVAPISVPSTPLTREDYRDINLAIQGNPKPRAVDVRDQVAYSGGWGGMAFCSGLMSTAPVNSVTGQWFTCSSGMRLGYDASTGRFLTTTGQVVLPDSMSGISSWELDELNHFFNIGANCVTITGNTNHAISLLD